MIHSTWAPGSRRTADRRADCVVILICAASSSVVSALQPSVGLLSCPLHFLCSFLQQQHQQSNIFRHFFFYWKLFCWVCWQARDVFKCWKILQKRQFQATIEWRRIMIVAMLFKSKFPLSWGSRSGPIRPLHNVRSVFRALWPFRPSSALCRSCVTGCTFYLRCRACWD